MEFDIDIDAPREKVWNTLWNKETYPEWTAAFAEGSRAETDWQKGSKVMFLDAKNSGMVSVIAENKPNEFMSIKHLGIIKNGRKFRTAKRANNGQVLTKIIAFGKRWQDCAACRYGRG